MKIGDYVRTKNGNIRKIVELDNTKNINEPDCFVDKILIDIEQNNIEDTIYLEKWLYEEEIVKSSPNIIDLIEVGDYVNGVKVDYTNVKDKLSYEDKCIVFYDGDGDISLFENDIKSIVTKEQFESIEYEVNK